MTFRIVLLGDSHMEALASALPTPLASLGLQVVYAEANRGKSTAWYVAQGKLGSAVAQYHPDVLLVELGTNDQPNADYEATLRAAVEQIRAAGSPEIIWFGPSFSATSLQARLQDVKDRQAATLPALGVRWFDSWPMTQRNHAPDGVHFTQAGYRSWAAGMAGKVATTSSPIPAPAPVLPLVALALTAIVGTVLLVRSFR
jgi:lysophospholipase L1-like esterase